MALYDVTDEDVAQLDEWESVSTGLFLKTRVRIDTLEGEQLAWAYVLDAYEGGLPSASYLGMLADAAERPAPPTTTSRRSGPAPAAPAGSAADRPRTLRLRPMTDTSARNITCTVDEGVARVWLDRPDKLNGLTLDMLASSPTPPVGSARTAPCARWSSPARASRSAPASTSPRR